MPSTLGTFKEPHIVHIDYDECWLINQGSSDGARFGRTKCIERKEEKEDGSLSDKTFCNPDFIQMIMHQAGHIIGMPHLNKHSAIMAENVTIPSQSVEGKNYELDTKPGSDIWSVRQTKGTRFFNHQ